MGYLTSGNEIVDAMGSINISGNIIPAIWYKTITKENGKPYLLAIVILADIVYWYRPSEVRDQGTGHILGWKKKFSEDILRQSYQYYADLFGESKKTVKTAMDKLEQLQVIRREFRTVSYGDGLVCNNVMYVELKPDMLYRLTFPEEIPAMNGENNSYADVSDVKMGGRLPTKSDTPMEISGGRGIPNGIQVSTKWDTGHDETDNTLSPEPDTGLSKNGETDSYTTANITDGESYHIHQADGETEKTIDAMEDVNAYIEIIKENIEYDHYMKYSDWQDRELYDELFEIICEVVCVKHKTVRIGGDDYPYELVKSKFLKLNSSHLNYVIGCMKNTTTKIIICFDIRDLGKQLKELGAALIDMCRSAKQPNMAVTIGEFQGFKMSVSFDSFFSKFTVSLKGSLSHEVEIGADPLGNLQRLSNALEGMTGKMADVEQKLSNVEHQLETAKVEVTKPFAQEQELAEKLERLAELNALLNMDEKGDNALDMGDDEPEDETGEQSTQAQESEPDRAEDIQAVAEEPLKPVASFLMSERIAEHDKERMLADGSRGRVSVKEKLAEMKQKISDQKMPEKPKTKRQEASL